MRRLADAQGVRSEGVRNGQGAEGASRSRGIGKVTGTAGIGINFVGNADETAKTSGSLLATSKTANSGLFVSRIPTQIASSPMTEDEAMKFFTTGLAKLQEEVGKTVAATVKAVEESTKEIKAAVKEEIGAVKEEMRKSGDVQRILLDTDLRELILNKIKEVIRDFQGTKSLDEVANYVIKWFVSDGSRQDSRTMKIFNLAKLLLEENDQEHDKVEAYVIKLIRALVGSEQAKEELAREKKRAEEIENLRKTAATAKETAATAKETAATAKETAATAKETAATAKETAATAKETAATAKETAATAKETAVEAKETATEARENSNVARRAVELKTRGERLRERSQVDCFLGTLHNVIDSVLASILEKLLKGKDLYNLIRIYNAEAQKRRVELTNAGEQGKAARIPLLGSFAFSKDSLKNISKDLLATLILLKKVGEHKYHAFRALERGEDGRGIYFVAMEENLDAQDTKIGRKIYLDELASTKEGIIVIGEIELEKDTINNGGNRLTEEEVKEVSKEIRTVDSDSSSANGTGTGSTTGGAAAGSSAPAGNGTNKGGKGLGPKTPDISIDGIGEAYEVNFVDWLNMIDGDKTTGLDPPATISSSSPAAINIKNIFSNINNIYLNAGIFVFVSLVLPVESFAATLTNNILTVENGDTWGHIVLKHFAKTGAKLWGENGRAIETWRQTKGADQSYSAMDRINAGQTIDVSKILGQAQTAPKKPGVITQTAPTLDFFTAHPWVILAIVAAAAVILSVIAIKLYRHYGDNMKEWVKNRLQQMAEERNSRAKARKERKEAEAVRKQEAAQSKAAEEAAKKIQEGAVAGKDEKTVDITATEETNDAAVKAREDLRSIDAQITLAYGHYSAGKYSEALKEYEVAKEEIINKIGELSERVQETGTTEKDRIILIGQIQELKDDFAKAKAGIRDSYFKLGEKEDNDIRKLNGKGSSPVSEKPVVPANIPVEKTVTVSSSPISKLVSDSFLSVLRNTLEKGRSYFRLQDAIATQPKETGVGVINFTLAPPLERIAASLRSVFIRNSNTNGGGRNEKLTTGFPRGVKDSRDAVLNGRISGTSPQSDSGKPGRPGYIGADRKYARIKAAFKTRLHTLGEYVLYSGRAPPYLYIASAVVIPAVAISFTTSITNNLINLTQPLTLSVAGVLVAKVVKGGAGALLQGLTPLVAAFTTKLEGGVPCVLSMLKRSGLITSWISPRTVLPLLPLGRTTDTLEYSLSMTSPAPFIPVTAAPTAGKSSSALSVSSSALRSAKQEGVSRSTRLTARITNRDGSRDKNRAVPAEVVSSSPVKMDRRGFLKLAGWGAAAYFGYIVYRDLDIFKLVSEYFDRKGNPLQKKSLKNIDLAMLDFVRGINRIFKEEKEADRELQDLIILLKSKKALSPQDSYRLNVLDYQLKLTKSGIDKIKENKENIISSAKKWNIEPAFLASILFAEYMDMEKGENFVDFWGSFIGNTSVGFGQVQLSTYRSYYSDSWIIRKLPRPVVAFILRFDKPNIEVAAWYIRYLASLGNKKLARSDSWKQKSGILKYHSKYWDEGLKFIIAVSYTANPFSEKVLNHKKPPFVNYGRYDLNRKEARDEREPAAQGYAVLEAYKLIKRLSIFNASSSPIAARILIVDDQEWQRELVRIVLEREGYVVEEAANGREALEKFNAGRFDLVVTDNRMPEMYGTVLVGELIKLNPTLPIIFMSGTERITETQRIKNVSKPYDINVFAKQVAELLELSSSSPVKTIKELKAEIRALEAKVKRLESEKAELEKVSRVDSLTNLYNRRDFDDTLKGWMRNADRIPGRRLLFVLIDIDFFGIVNNIFGHSAGDKVLKLFANTVKNKIRPAVDYIARYGGEEFALLLTGVDEELARERIINRCAESVKRLGFPVLQAALRAGVIGDKIAEITAAADRAKMHSAIIHQLSVQGLIGETEKERLNGLPLEKLPYASLKKWVITFSAGVASYQKGMPGAELLRRADEVALAVAKIERNNIEIFTGKTASSPAEVKVNTSMVMNLVKEVMKEEGIDFNKLVSVYLFGSAVWFKNPDDYDVVIFIDDAGTEKRTFYTGKTAGLDYSIANYHYFTKENKESIESNMELIRALVRLYSTRLAFGRNYIIKGPDILGKIIRRFSIFTPGNLIELARRSIFTSQTLSDPVETAEKHGI
ncbi:MAG: diguanylate cyclase, partial [Candidatus Omnitrophota bacterium]